VNNDWLKHNKSERIDAVSGKGIWNHKRMAYHRLRYKFAKEFACGRVLDAACGTGYGSTLLKYDEYVGIDVSSDAIQYANATYPNNYYTMNLIKPKSLGLFDCIVSLETLEHLIKPNIAVDFFNQSLVSGGTIVVSVPNKWRLTRYHKQKFNVHKLRNMMKSRFNEQGMWCCDSGKKAEAGITLNEKLLETTECLIYVGVKR